MIWKSVSTFSTLTFHLWFYFLSLRWKRILTQLQLAASPLPTSFPNEQTHFKNKNVSEWMNEQIDNFQQSESMQQVGGNNQKV